MKRILIALLVISVVFSIFSGCKANQEIELVVFAAASLTETLTELGNRYMETHPNTKIVFNFDSSGALKTQIEEGAECDLFISAGQKQLDQLDISADPTVNSSGLDFVAEGSRINMLENRVALVRSEWNHRSVNSFDDLCKALETGSIIIAVGNSDVPVGQYTEKIFEFYGLSEEELVSGGHITYATNVKEITIQVKEGTVDCGIVYATDAYSAGLAVVDTASAEMCGRVIYPAAIMKNSKRTELASDFLTYLCSAEADEVFSAVGFTPILD